MSLAWHGPVFILASFITINYHTCPYHIVYHFIHFHRKATSPFFTFLSNHTPSQHTYVHPQTHNYRKALNYGLPKLLHGSRHCVSLCRASADSYVLGSGYGNVLQILLEWPLLLPITHHHPIIPLHHTSPSSPPVMAQHSLTSPVTNCLSFHHHPSPPISPVITPCHHHITPITTLSPQSPQVIPSLPIISITRFHSINSINTSQPLIPIMPITPQKSPHHSVTS